MTMNRTLFFLIFLLSTSICQALQVTDLSYIDSLVPGESKRVKVTLINDRDIPENVDLKICDYATNCEGEHFYEEPGTFQRTNGPWVTLASNRVYLAPNEQSDFYFTIDVPKDSNLKGSYWSIMFIEPVEPVQKFSESADGFSLNVKIRFAYHIVTNVGKGLAKLKILKKDFKMIEDNQFFYVDVSNTGELFLNPKLSLKLYDGSGKLAKTIEGQPERLYPGSSQRYLIDTKEIERSKYTAFLLLDNGDSHLFGDTFELMVP